MESYKVDINAQDLLGKLQEQNRLFDLISGLVTQRAGKPLHELAPSVSILSLGQDNEHGDGSLTFFANFRDDRVVSMMADQYYAGSKDCARAVCNGNHVHMLVIHVAENDVMICRKLIPK
jgi:hypothetical protein